MSSHLEEPAGAVDRLLIERYLNGDTDAFGELYRRHYDRLLRFVRGRVRDTTSAEDLAHEAITRALAAVDRLRDPTRFYPWLTVIARHLIVGYHRTNARLSPVADVDPGATNEPLDSRLMRQIEHDDLQRALSRVRKRHRDILEMREHEQLSYEEIAKRLGTPLTTIPPLLFRARQALRREFFALSQEDPKSRALIPAMFEALRRLRLRVARYTTWLPDANTVCASATCVVVGVSTILSLSGPTPESPGRHSLSWTSDAADERGDGPPAAAQLTAGSPVRARADVGSPRQPTPRPTVVGIAQINIDNERHTHNRERARQMPIYHEAGPVWFSADPDAMRRDIESSLAGDTEWMEGSS